MANWSCESWSCDKFISWYESWSGGNWSHENWSPERKPISCIGSKFTRMSTHPGVTFAWLMVCTCGVIEAQFQALCPSEVRNFSLYGPYKAALWASGVHSASYTMVTVTWCCSECCVLSGLDFKVAGDPGVCYCLSKYLLRGHQVNVNMIWALLHGLINTWKCAHPT